MAESLTKNFNSWLRKTSRQTSRQPTQTQPQTVKCSSCAAEISDATRKLFEEHLRSKHAEVFENSASDEKDTRASSEAKVEQLWKESLGAGPARCVQSAPFIHIPWRPSSPASAYTRADTCRLVP